MANNKILDLLKVAVLCLLLCATSMKSFAENGDGELDVALGFQLGGHGFTGISSNLCPNLQRESKNNTCGYVRNTALYGAPYLRLGLAPHHSVMVSYNLTDEIELKLTRFCIGQEPSCVLAGERPAFISLRSAVMAYEYRTPLGALDLEGSLKAGYHDSKFNRNGATVGVNGIVLGAGFVYDENILVGYEYLDAGEELKIRHSLYMGVEFGL